MPGVSGVQIGVVGKPNVGKSTFFAAATLHDVKIAPYPFTTIDPNVGIGYARFECICRELGVKDNPRNSLCIEGWRFASIELIDVAGLVPEAWKGRGLGNRFLDHLRRADALIHVIDAAGSTDSEGRPIEPGSHDPLTDVEFLERELDMWIFGILEKDWKRFAMTVEAMGAKLDEELYKRLSGLSVNEKSISDAIEAAGLQSRKPTTWTTENLLGFVKELRARAKPMIIAANKADQPTAKQNIERIREMLKGRYVVIPTSAEAELVLRKAAVAGLIRYLPGDNDFEVIGRLNEKQETALELIRKRVLKVWGSTGVQQAINTLVFSVLNCIAVFPVADEHKLSDNQGQVLPDVYLLRKGSTIRDLAYAIHSDFGEKFITAIDAISGKRMGANDLLTHRSVVKIVAGR